jgi:hypothetical protein
MKINYSQLKQIIDKQYAESEITPRQGGVQSLLNGNPYTLFNMATSEDNYNHIRSVIQSSIFGKQKTDNKIDDEVFLYRHLNRLQEKFKQIHKQL